MVRAYQDRELLDKAFSLPSFDCIPGGYWILGVRSAADIPNYYDDKFYIFHAEQFKLVLSGTTHPGTYGLKHFMRWNSKGAAVLKANEWYYDVYQKSDNSTIRHHNGVMPCLRQVLPFKYYRDNNKNLRSEELGLVYEGIINANFHANSYTRTKGIIDWHINGWSTACQVTNNLTRYYYLLDMLPFDTGIHYCLINEF